MKQLNGQSVAAGGVLTRVEACENHAQDGRYKLAEKVPTLSSKMGQGGDNVPYALYTYVGNSSGDDIAGTIDSSYYKGTGSRSGNEREVVCMGFLPLAGEKCGSVAETENGAPTLRATSPTACVIALDVYNGKTGKVSKTLNSAATDSDHIPCVIALDRSSYNQGKNAKYDIGVDTEGIAFTVTAKGPGAVCYEKETQYVVRRLTPLECCHLQGMPDWWEEGVDGADSARYKMWGNGMALPNALYVMEGFNEQ